VTGQEVICPAIQAVAGQQVAPGAHEAEQDRRHRRHPGRRGDRGLRVLKRRQFVMQVPLGQRRIQPDDRHVLTGTPDRPGLNYGILLVEDRCRSRSVMRVGNRTR
jgi:hypothetical protein